MGASAAMICANFAARSLSGPPIPADFWMIASERALIDGRLRSMRPSSIASSTSLAGLVNGWPEALWQSMQSIRRFSIFSASARETPRGGVEVRRLHLAVGAAHLDQRDLLLLRVERDVLDVLRDVPVDALGDGAAGAQLRRDVLVAAGERRARPGVHLQRRLALRALWIGPRSDTWCGSCRRGAPRASGTPRTTRAPDAGCAS